MNKDELINEIKNKLDIAPYDEYADEVSRAYQDAEIDTYKRVVDAISSTLDGYEIVKKVCG